MSCNILVNLNDLSPENYSNSKRSNLPSGNASLKTSLVRALRVRRLKSFKLFMATVVVILLLFFILRPNPANHEVPPDNGKSQSWLASQPGSGANDLVGGGVSHISQRSDGPKSTDKNSLLTDEPIYPNNLTHLLTLRDFANLKKINLMQVRIREAMKHSWDNYRRYAWGHDMLKPRSKEPDHWFNLGLTIVDSADSLIMMGMANDINLALDWIENELSFKSTNENSNCFELTIRVLGGILSAYHLTSRKMLRHQAVRMGDILLHCYETESKVIPNSDINLSDLRSHPPLWNPYSSLSEVTSIQLEFRYLSQITGNLTYEQTSFQTNVHIHNLTSDGQKLVPMYINPDTGLFASNLYTIGARGDSYYEYLLKQYLQTGIKWLEDDYLDGVDQIASKMLRYTNGPENYTYVAEIQVFKTLNNTEDVKYYNKMDHLVCFLPGTLALGYYHFSPLASERRLFHNLETPANKLNSRYDNHLKIAKDLARTCNHMYINMGTGLSPEIANFVHSQDDDPLIQSQPELQVQPTSAHNILRPEFVESLFYLYHITGLPMYRDQARQIFEGFQKYSRILTGYSPISDVRHKPPNDANLHETLHKNAPDRMESFWLSETLKYLYLTFCDDRLIISTLLNNYVFNTEGHIVPII